MTGLIILIGAFLVFVFVMYLIAISEELPEE